jgi:hypothetical protein
MINQLIKKRILKKKRMIKNRQRQPQLKVKNQQTTAKIIKKLNILMMQEKQEEKQEMKPLQSLEK